MRARAVIGANLGDECKGLMVDYFSSRDQEASKLVVRFNGSAQAGHTVQLADGRRHVFHHFGSGTFAGAKTFLSKFFAVHPMLFQREHEELSAALNVSGTSGYYIPQLHVDRRCIVVTPYDVLLNQAIETSLGNARLGSTGTGVSEAALRSQDHEFRLTVGDMYDKKANDVLQQISRIRDVYVPRRLSRAGVKLGELLDDLLHSLQVHLNFVSDANDFCQKIRLTDERIMTTYDDVIFEGAQGLMLDWVNGTFPHVTRSRTGITNVITLCETARIKKLEAVYVTRPYVTRHGAGPLLWEVPPFAVDETNVPHPYQGTLRYGQLDVSPLRARIELDLRQADHLSIQVKPSLAITCMNHAHLVELKNGGFDLDEKLDLEHLDREIARLVGIDSYYGSDGPTRKNVR